MRRCKENNGKKRKEKDVRKDKGKITMEGKKKKSGERQSERR